MTRNTKRNKEEEEDMHSDLVHTTSKIITLGRSGRIACARKLFDELCYKDLIAWNAMLTSYTQLGLYRESLNLFFHMRISGSKPDYFSFTAALSACVPACSLNYGRKIHAQVINCGYQSSLPVNNSLINMYGKCLNPCSARMVFEDMNLRNEISWCSLLFAYTNFGQFDYAQETFDIMPNRVEISWNILISGHARYGEVGKCMLLLKKMRKGSYLPDQWTYSALMNACTESPETCYGYIVHALILKIGWSSAVEVNNSVLSFYTKQSLWDDAKKVFESSKILTQVSWNAIIDAHMKMGDIHKAFLAFKQAPMKNVISWTTLINGYAKNGHKHEALECFLEMIRNLVKPDDFTFGAVLHACSSFAMLGHGKMVHGCIIVYGFHSYVYVANGLVNMYAKCGNIEESIQAFDDILNKDLVSWNTMLLGLGLHGRATEALQLYEEMVKLGVRLDKVTFIGLLVACSHSGSVEKGTLIFESIESLYGLPYEMDHIACMVDILGRSGYLPEAREMAKKYYKLCDQVKSISYEALVGACFSHGDFGMGRKIGGQLMILEPCKEISYVMLSNLYCASGKWNEAENVRKRMRDHGVNKLPGCSWIEVRNKVTTFVAGNPTHPLMTELGKLLYYLNFETKNTCFNGLNID